MTSFVQTRRLRGSAGDICVHLQGDRGAPVVVMTHSILSSSMMWQEQATLLAANGWRVVRMDTRGHGGSACEASQTSMDDLAGDTLAVLDGLNIERAHYVGLSLGGMSGFGLGINHADRFYSLVLCDARADMPAEFSAPWDERIAVAQSQGCEALAMPTIERWFGRPFLDRNRDVEQAFAETVGATSTAGFTNCAQAIQSLDYLPRVLQIKLPITFIVGSNDGPLPQVMQELSKRVAGCVLELIDGSGHLPNIDNPSAFNAALMRHFSRQSQRSAS